jgi:hypothetical protein
MLDATRLLYRLDLAAYLTTDGDRLHVAVGNETDRDYCIEMPLSHVRALADVLNAVIAARPDAFPLTHTRRIEAR